jgi:hypothetical protein
MLTNSERGRQAWLMLTMKNPQLWDAISKGILFSQIDMQLTIGTFSTSLLYNILCNPKGIDFVLQCTKAPYFPTYGIDLSFIPHLVTKTNASKISQIYPLLFVLFGSTTGTNLLIKLHDLEPNLMQGVTIEALLAKQLQNQATVLHFLTHVNGIFLFQKWIKLNPLSVAKFPLEALLMEADNLIFEHTLNAAPFYQILLFCPNGEEVLYDFIKNRPQSFAKHLTTKALCTPYFSKEVVINDPYLLVQLPPLNLLCLTSVGLQILFLVLKENKQLAADISLSLWCKEYCTTSYVPKPSALAYLFANSDPICKDILQLLPLSIVEIGEKMYPSIMDEDHLFTKYTI